MGKGKRMRQQRFDRIRAVGELVPDAFPFEVDQRTAQELGSDGLAELAANLWPKDCQTCGWELAGSRPTVRIDDMITGAVASLHHPHCRPPQWSEQPQLIKQPLTSYTVLAFRIPHPARGLDDSRPFFLVNPNLEAVSLRQTDSGWKVSTLQLYTRRGLVLPPKLRMDVPLPDMVADLDGNTLRVTLEDFDQRWETPVDDGMVADVRRCGGVGLAVTTAGRPDEMTGQDWETIARAGHVALGWVGLRGVERPLDTASTEVPAEMRTFVVHWGPRHASVGELLATTSADTPEEAAKAWAVERIERPAEFLGEWQLASPADPSSWAILDGITAAFYFLRRHTDSWVLVRSLSRMDGATWDHAEVVTWASGAVRARAGHRVLGWVEAAGTGAAGFTTLHGSAVPL